MGTEEEIRDFLAQIFDAERVRRGLSMVGFSAHTGLSMYQTQCLLGKRRGNVSVRALTRACDALGLQLQITFDDLQVPVLQVKDTP